MYLWKSNMCLSLQDSSSVPPYNSLDKDHTLSPAATKRRPYNKETTVTTQGKE